MLLKKLKQLRELREPGVSLISSDSSGPLAVVWWGEFPHYLLYELLYHRAHWRMPTFLYTHILGLPTSMRYLLGRIFHTVAQLSKKVGCGINTSWAQLISPRSPGPAPSFQDWVFFFQFTDAGDNYNKRLLCFFLSCYIEMKWYEIISIFIVHSLLVSNLRKVGNVALFR